MRTIKTKEVLKVIGLSGIVVASVALPNLPIAVMQVYKLWKDINKSDLGRIIKRLEKQEMISIRETEGVITIEITEKGKKRLLAYDFENIKLKAKKRDGKWRLIIFDIPEGKKQNREAFRKKLIEIGCIWLQDSVFVSAFPCKDEIDFLSNYLEISDFITVVVVDRIERGEQLIFKERKDWDNGLL